MTTIIETVYGNKTQEQIEFLTIKCPHKVLQLVAYNGDNGYIKLFTYQDFFNFYCLGNNYNSNDITLNEYNDDETFEDFIKKTFFIK